MKLLYVIGDPVEHSLSPLMHNAAIEFLGLQDEYYFDRARVPADGLKDFIESTPFHGLAVTRPNKAAIIPYLDKISSEAKMASAVNTVIRENGTLEVHNTDGPGTVRAIHNAGVRIENRTIAVLGAGGSARAIVNSLAHEGAEKIIVLNRTVENARKIAENVSNVEAHGLNHIEDALAHADILINTASAGNLVKKELIKSNMAVFDIVYKDGETDLLRNARNIGAIAIPGTEMLLYQGAIQFELFTGRPAPIDIMKNTLAGVNL